MFRLSAAMHLCQWATENPFGLFQLSSQNRPALPRTSAPAHALKFDVTIRPFEEADTDACMAIWRAASESGHPFLSAGELDADEALIRRQYIGAARITVAEINDVPVGFIAMIGSYIGALFVHPDYHRKGVATRLLSHAEVQASALEVDVYFDNQGARAFYEAEGFEAVYCCLSDEQGRALRVLHLARPQQH